MNPPVSRRSALGQIVGTAALMAAAPLSTRVMAQDTSPASSPLKGQIHHSACRWCYKQIELEELCRAGKEMGLVALDLIDPPDFPTLKKHGLVCSMVNYPTADGLGGIRKAWNRVEHHDKLVAAYEERLQVAADAGYERVICFSGNREGL